LSRWFRYPAGFSNLALDRALSRVDLPDGALVADPFAGAAVGGTYMTARGFRYIGIEAHPLVAELAELKFARKSTGEEVRALAYQVAVAARKRGTSNEPDLVRSCFWPGTLGVLVALREEIRMRHGSAAAAYLKWALLGTLRDCANVRVGWPYQRPAIRRHPTARRARERFVARALAIADDLDNHSFQSLDGRVVVGDSRTDAAWTSALGAAHADACLTSPPYLNNYDYADATRLEAYFWGIADSWRTLVLNVRSSMIAATTQQTSKRRAELATCKVADDSSFGRNVKSLAASLAAEKAKRKRGKEYDALLLCYLADMQDVFRHLAQRLRPGAPAVLVVGDSAPYGVYLDTPGLLANLATREGFLTESIDHLRDRGLRWRENGSRHQVSLAEKLVVLRAPR
jgi:hypothetical protein